jgi:hypothetical protein
MFIRLCRFIAAAPVKPRLVLRLLCNVEVHDELWPVHCMTPKYALHGPTASRY